MTEEIILKNEDIRIALLKGNVRNYQLASELGITEFTLSRWLREELPTEKKRLMLLSICKLSKREEAK